MSVVRKVLLADQAELDLLEITLWALEKFGNRQAVEYAETVSLEVTRPRLDTLPRVLPIADEMRYSSSSEYFTPAA